jgi:succinate-semialdehyde dehydrogenase/glutarate-semialdehyde dehydrogenase
MKKVVPARRLGPFLVLDDADVDAAAKAAVIGRLANGGQACTASKPFIVEDGCTTIRCQTHHGMAGWQPGDRPTPRRKWDRWHRLRSRGAG